MAIFYIREENLERLEKKLATIEKKCRNTHTSFKYEITGEEYKEFTPEDGDPYIVRYIIVDVEGEAKYNGWRFVATLDHHKEGNVIRTFDHDLAIPDRYLTCGPTCEHCNKIRSRKDTYLVYNDEKNEFKQVGRSCLQEFTNGLSAEDVAFLVSIYDQAEAAGHYSGPSAKSYIDVENILRYAFECYRHWGYQKSESSFEEWEEIPNNYRSTRSRVVDYYYIRRALGSHREALRAEMEEVGFDPESDYARETTKAALEWIQNLTEADMDSNYIRNLHVICSDEYIEFRSLGILVSLTVAYARHMDQIAAYEKKQKAIEREQESSEYLGEIKDKVEINCSCRFLSSWCNMYESTYLYKFTDDSGNVAIWYASKPIDDPDLVVSVKGTIKDLSEYNGTKQTVLTRCKVTLAPKATEDCDNEVPAQGTDNVQEALDMFFNAVSA